MSNRYRKKRPKDPGEWADFDGSTEEWQSALAAYLRLPPIVGGILHLPPDDDSRTIELRARLGRIPVVVSP